MFGEYGVVWWNEINTHDTERTRAFYCRVMGWTPVLTAMTDMGRSPNPGEASYTTFMKGKTPVCGAYDLRTLPELADLPDFWMTYLSVPDCDESCREAVSAGGEVLKPPFDVPGVGRVAIIRDATGAMVGLGTPEAPCEAA